jgi:hypothetical protein
VVWSNDPDWTDTSPRSFRRRWVAAMNVLQVWLKIANCAAGATSSAVSITQAPVNRTQESMVGRLFVILRDRVNRFGRAALKTPAPCYALFPGASSRRSVPPSPSNTLRYVLRMSGTNGFPLAFRKFSTAVVDSAQVPRRAA